LNVASQFLPILINVLYILAKSDLQKKTFKACTYIYIPKRITGLTDENKSNSTTAKVALNVFYGSHFWQGAFAGFEIFSVEVFFYGMSL
jgi:hypothetical protein